MTKATALLFTSITCPHCPVAKKVFAEVAKERNDVDMHSLQTHESQAKRLARKFGIQSVPTFIFYGPGHEAPMGLAGVQSKSTVNKYIDIAVGTKKLPDPSEKKEFSFRNLFKRKKTDE